MGVRAVQQDREDVAQVEDWFPVPRRGTMDAVWCSRCGQPGLETVFMFGKSWLVCPACGRVVLL